MATLTKKQKQILNFIESVIKKHGYSPTFDEIKDEFNLSALSGVYQHIDALAKKGFIRKNDNSSRGISLISNVSKAIEVPLLGKIAAGAPIEAIETYGETITIPESEINSSKKHYALKVAGDSMIEEGIFDGDVVVIREQKTAENGQTVVAIIDDNEATLKKLYKEKARIRLQPANPTLFPIFRTEVEIRGIVVKIIRNLEVEEKEKSFLMETLSSFPYTNNAKRITDEKSDKKAKPFLQWVGGKREMIPQYNHLLPKTYGRFFELFLGGGAMFFYLEPKQSIINDNNRELIETYKAIKESPDDVVKYLRELKKRHSKELYDKIRGIDREIDIYKKLSPTEIAARMIYLNQTCFNGLYRVNQSGQFNVPIGSSLNRLICDKDNIKNASKSLQNTEILSEDFEKIAKKAEKNDFVYIDPPYYPVSKYSDFTRYTKEKFYQEDQTRLKETVDRLTEKGVKVMLSNSDCEFIRDLYVKYKIHEVVSGRNLNCKKEKRGKVSELVITNY